LLRRAFGGSLPTDEELTVSKETLEFDRTLAVFDGRQVVGTAGIFSYEMAVPGGSLPCGGVTRVGVAATHRRRGLLTAMMRRQLDDMHQRGEPLAALYASEAPIYGRFGYGLATYQAEIEIQQSRGGFAKPLAGRGRVVMVDVPAAVDAFTQVWARVHPMQPGMLGLDARWWRLQLADLETNRQGFSPHYRVVYQADGKPAGFAIYRIKMEWDPAGPAGTLRLESLIAPTSEAYAALWRYVLDVDLITRISAEMRPIDEPLRFLLADSRQPKMRVEDGIWLRLVDVERALAGRRYAVEGGLVLRVHDAFCPWNDGHYELNGGPMNAVCERCESNPDLELSSADLAAVYLGGNRFRTLYEAGRIHELRPGALERADAMFATDRAPWCPSHF
jgi:predicted acetyltransferase